MKGRFVGLKWFVKMWYDWMFLVNCCWVVCRDGWLLVYLIRILIMMDFFMCGFRNGDD